MKPSTAVEEREAAGICPRPMAEVNTSPRFRKVSTSVHPDANDRQARPRASRPMCLSEAMFMVPAPVSRQQHAPRSIPSTEAKVLAAIRSRAGAAPRSRRQALANGFAVAIPDAALGTASDCCIFQ
jgi:hypothetical protein